MRNAVLFLRLALAVLFGVFAAAPRVWAEPPARLHVLISGGFSAAYAELVPRFEAASGIGVATIHGPSMGNAPQSIPNRLARGETADVVILADSALDRLIGQGRILSASKTDLAQSLIAVAVKEGAALPAITTLSSLTQALTAAKSIAVSASASGIYVSTELLKKLGIEDEVRNKILIARGEPVGEIVARGEADIGLQQLSELRPIKGITIAGLLPPEAQKITTFSAGIVKGAANQQAGQDLIRFLTSQDTGLAIQRAGMVPAKPVP